MESLKDPVTATRPRIGFIGAGRVGTTLGAAFARAGWPVGAVASRSADRRDEFERLVPGAVGVERPADLLDLVDIVFVTVPDDAIAGVAAGLRLYSGQAIVHTSGLLPSTVLEPALAAGCAAASFHPLVAFADRARALAALTGASVALEGDDRLVGVLGALAEAIGARPVRVETAGKAAYHVAAVLAAGGTIGLLGIIAQAARGAGLDEAGALAVYAPLIRQALANAEALGVDAALTGPIARGDVGTVERHLDVLGRVAPSAIEAYVSLARAQLVIAERGGGLAPETLDRLRALLADGPRSSSM
jgi:predicted short-subunit dehydrogenase-like oxidoreductase (DUF2520 family)